MTADRTVVWRLRERVSWLLVACAIVGTAASSGAAEPEPRFSALVFSKTTGFRHDSIPQGIAAIKALGADNGFAVDSTEDAARFTDAELAGYKVVVFLNTTGDILDDRQKAAFERYIRSGGGFVNVITKSGTNQLHGSGFFYWQPQTLTAKFANGVNFRGFPHMPGNDFVTAIARSGDPANDGASRVS